MPQTPENQRWCHPRILLHQTGREWHPLIRVHPPNPASKSQGVTEACFQQRTAFSRERPGGRVSGYRHRHRQKPVSVYSDEILECTTVPDVSATPKRQFRVAPCICGPNAPIRNVGHEMPGVLSGTRRRKNLCATSPLLCAVCMSRGGQCPPPGTLRGSVRCTGQFPHGRGRAVLG